MKKRNERAKRASGFSAARRSSPAADPDAAAAGRVEGDERQRDELRHRGGGEEAAAGERAREGDEAPDEQGADQLVVGVALHHERRVGIGDPGEDEGQAEDVAVAIGEPGREPAADPAAGGLERGLVVVGVVVAVGAAPAADQDEPEREQAGDRRRVEEDRRRVGGGQLVPGPAPRQDRLERHVGEVVGGPVGVAGRVVVGEGVVVDRLGVGDLVGADHARVADVDDARVGEVAGEAEGDQGDDRHRHRPDRQARSQALAGRAVEPVAAEADPEHADQQVDEQRIDDRDRGADLGGVEERLADPEREQDEQVEVDPLAPAPEVPEAEQEDERQRDPDVGGVEDVPELAGLAARHRPVDGRAGPRLGRLAGLAVDDDEVDLRRRSGSSRPPRPAPPRP